MLAAPTIRAAEPRAGNRFPRLFSPFRLGGLSLRNRVVMAPMSSSLGGLDGSVTPELEAYLVERARGGTGLVIVEFTAVDARHGLGEARQLRLDDDRFIAGHRTLVQRLIEAGAATCLQLHLPGRYIMPATLAHGVPAAPSDVRSKRDGTLVARALLDEEVGQLIERFGQAAERALAAGYQSIELHGAHGYLLMAFLSPLHNQRDDRWGGDGERRLAFPLAVIRRVKAALGADVPLIYRVSGDEFRPGGLTLDDMERIVPRLVAAGVDAIHVSSGAVEGALDRIVDPMSTPQAWRFPMSRRLGAAACVPVIAVGPVRWPATAEAALARGDADLIALGRPLLADPHWARKAEAGDAQDITPCTNCNWCMERVRQHLPAGCAENPRTGRESLALAFRASRQRAAAVVIGAGPAGIVAALELDAAGYATHLFEERREVGGGLFASSMPPHKERLLWYLDHLRSALARSGVTQHLGVRAGLDQVQALAPAFVVVASGSQQRPLAFDAPPEGTVLDAHTVLMGDAEIGAGAEPVIVYGGGEAGCESAEYLAARGLAVTLVTRSPVEQLARGAEPLYRRALLARLRGNALIRIVAGQRIAAFRNGAVEFVGASGEHTAVPARTLLLAQGRDPNGRLALELERAGIACRRVGDASSVGRIGDAVHDAFFAVRELDAAAHAHDAKPRSCDARSGTPG